MKKRGAKLAATEFKISASDVLKRLDEKFSQFDKRFSDQAEAALAARDEMKADIRALGEKIDAQIHTFDKQLDRLNGNMENVMKQISDHEFRLTQLELEKREKKVEDKTWEKAKQYAWKAAQGGFYFLFLLGAAYGIKPLVKIFNFLGN
jgi:uncharacterized protein (DUF3084 family)